MEGFRWRNPSKCAYLAPDRISSSVGQALVDPKRVLKLKIVLYFIYIRRVKLWEFGL
jgi:hypothetical protein